MRKRNRSGSVWKKSVRKTIVKGIGRGYDVFVSDQIGKLKSGLSYVVLADASGGADFNAGRKF